MSILFEAWRRARGEDARLAETLGAPPPAIGPRRTARLPWLLAGVLAAVAAGLGVYLWRIERAPQPQSSPPAGSRTAAAAPSVSLPHATVADASARPAASASAGAAPPPASTPVLAVGTPAAASPSSSSAAGAAYVATSAVATRAAVASPVASQPAAADASGPAAVSTTNTGVPVDVRAALPTFNVMVHVWNADPDRRFVVVDGRIFRAGDELAAGVKLVEITRAGEIVSFRGYRIELPGS